MTQKAVNDNVMSEEKKGTIVCVVVIYRAALTECDVYKTFIGKNLDKIDCLLVFDNSPESHYEKILLTNGQYKYYWNKDNQGVSCNYNKAAEYASTNGYEWLLLFDQDTVFPDNAMELYRSGIKENPNESILVPIHKTITGECLSPAKSLKLNAPQIKPGTHKLKDYDIINSGMLVKVSEFIAVGGYKNEVKLDFSDFQFTERLKKRIDTFGVLNIKCLQDFSNNQKDKEKLACRYRIYCESVLHFEADNIKTYAKITYLVIKHTVSLSARCKSFTFIKILLNTICKHKNDKNIRLHSYL